MTGNTDRCSFEMQLTDAFSYGVDPIMFLQHNTAFEWTASWSPNYVRVWANDKELGPVRRHRRGIGSDYTTLQDLVYEAEALTGGANPLHVYLDDERHPKTPRDWTVVRTVGGWERYLDSHTPTVVSLDHDLGEEDDRRTGLTCAHMLVEQTRKFQRDPATIEFNVHSANPVGADNIRRLWASYERFYKKHIKEE